MNYLPFQKGFKTYIQLERGLSENTLSAYLHDTALLFNFLMAQKEGKALSKLPMMI